MKSTDVSNRNRLMRQSPSGRQLQMPMLFLTSKRQLAHEFSSFYLFEGMGSFSQFQRRREARADSWQKDWEECFSPEPTDPNMIVEAYRRVMVVFAHDVGVHVEFVIPNAGRVPMNRR